MDYYKSAVPGGSGNTLAAVSDFAIAYNSANNEYLVVWSADDTDATGVVDGENEIFGQRIADGTPTVTPALNPDSALPLNCWLIS